MKIILIVFAIGFAFTLDAADLRLFGVTNQASFVGVDTNGLRSTFWWRADESGAIEIVPELENLKTNNGNIAPEALRLWLPPEKGRYKMTLIDGTGHFVKKTALGETLGTEFTTDIFQLRRLSGVILTKDNPVPLEHKGPMLLNDYFYLTNSGHYTFELQIGVIWLTEEANAAHKTVKVQFLPPVRAEFELAPKEAVFQKP